MKQACVCLLATLAIVANAASEAQSLLIANVNVVDVEDGVIQRGKDVLITASTITEVRAHVPAATDADTVLDATNQYVVPGFWDMHVHFRTRKFVADPAAPAPISENEELLSTFIRFGITSVFDMGSDIPDSLVSWRSSIESGDRVGPALYLTGQKFEGREPEFAGSHEILSEKDIDAALELAVASNFDGVKVMALWIEPAIQDYLLARSRQLGLKSFAHSLETMRGSDLSRSGFDAIAHLDNLLPEAARNFARLSAEVNGRKSPDEAPGDWFWELRPGFFADPDANVLRRSLRTLAANGTAVVSTYNASRLAVHHEQIVEQVLDPLETIGPRFSDRTRTRYLARLEREPTDLDRQLLAGNLMLLRLLPESDVLFLVGTDSGFGNHAPGASFHFEMAALQDAGLAPAYILRSATLNAAVFMGKQDTEGTVAPGMKADLVLLEGNPLDDIRHTRSITAVIRNGVVAWELH